MEHVYRKHRVAQKISTGIGAIAARFIRILKNPPPMEPEILFEQRLINTTETKPQSIVGDIITLEASMMRFFYSYELDFSISGVCFADTNSQH